MEGSLNNGINHATVSGDCINGAKKKRHVSEDDLKILQLLFERATCSLKLKRYGEVIGDCLQVRKIDCEFMATRVQNRLIFSLLQLGKVQDAQAFLQQWMDEDPNEKDIHRSLVVIKNLSEQLSDKKFIKKYIDIADDDSIIINQEFQDTDKKCNGTSHDVENYKCSFCVKNFSSDADFKVHCRSQEHASKVMSDEDRSWTYRSPPRGVSADQYIICESFLNDKTCRFGDQCTEAHSESELIEWKDRFSYRETKVAEAKESCLYDSGSSYTEKLLEKLFSAKNPKDVIVESCDDIQLASNPPELVKTVSSKQSTSEWTFTFSSDSKWLARIALLHDTHRPHFNLTSITPNEQGTFLNTQEWVNNVETSCQNSINRIDYSIKLQFTTDIFGTFRQAVVFDFGEEPVLMKKICIDVVPQSKLENLEHANQSISCSFERWHVENCELVPFEPKPSQYILSDEDKMLFSLYPVPHPERCIITQAAVEPKITPHNYHNKFHDLLHIEEMSQLELLSRFNISTTVHLINRYLITMATNSVARYATSGQLYAQLKLECELSEDTPAGRLVLTNCNTVLISFKTNSNNNSKKLRVYEVLIEDRGKDVSYLRLSKQCVEDLQLIPDTDHKIQVQFQLNRLSMCGMHHALDRIENNAQFIFPDISNSPNIPWNPKKQWNESLDERLNAKQREAIVAITSDVKTVLPPILLIGPFGTGKTFTLAQAVKQIVRQPKTRILICTHSNSAADLYIKHYFDAFCKNNPVAKPLRIFYKDRWVQTVDSDVLNYSLVQWNSDTGTSSFRLPNADDVKQHRIIVTTLSTSRSLLSLNLPKGFFTHIMIDEAAQALECETIMPLILADSKTKIVLAGDHMQLSPEIFSKFCHEKKLTTSLLERLYDHYPLSFNCRVLLCQNYRSHDVIVKYTSELFYENKLVTSGKQPPHDHFFPFTFFTARGEDMQDKNSTTFYNNAEVYEVVERVVEVLNTWPASWGVKQNSQIGVVSPYYDQVVKIRGLLRKRKLYGVNVERVLNVQGKQYRALFLSTVRTRLTCQQNETSSDDVDYGFLSNAKLLNTAITRAQSLVAVVGDPITLCSIGKCRKLWEKFIKVCSVNNSLYGITWNSLRSHLDGVELKKSTYVLNPLAPEFIPLRLRQEPSWIYNIPPVVYGQVMPALPPNMLPPGMPVHHPFYTPFPHPPPSYLNACMMPVHPRPAQPPYYGPVPHPPQNIVRSQKPNVYVVPRPYFPSPPPCYPNMCTPPRNPSPMMCNMPRRDVVNFQGRPVICNAPSPRSIKRDNMLLTPPTSSPNHFENKFAGKSTDKSQANLRRDCDLTAFVHIVKKYIYSEYNLEPLLVDASLQRIWTNHIHATSGPNCALDFSQLLNTISKMVQIGHCLPPIIGKNPCKICTTRAEHKQNGNKEACEVTVEPPKILTVQEVEESMLSETSEEDTTKSTSNENVHLDVVECVLDDPLADRMQKLSTNSNSSEIEGSLLYKLRKSQGSSGRSFSWTPSLNKVNIGNCTKTSLQPAQKPPVVHDSISSISSENSSSTSPRRNSIPPSFNCSPPSQKQTTASSDANTITYASVVRSALCPNQESSQSSGPLSIIKDLKGASGYYNYFS